MKIDSLAAWHLLAKDLAELGYTRWQTQYDVDCPEGFCARFYCSGKQDVEVVTFDKAVKAAILAYRL